MPERHSVSRRIITPGFKKLSIEEQYRIPGLSRSAYYYRPKQVEPERNLEDNAIDLRKGVAHYIDYYNTRRYHQGIDHQIPAARYAAAIAA